jgi:cytochrome c-type biogenesis protein CcsB
VPTDPVPGIDRGLEALSDNLLFVAVLVYTAAMLLFAAEWAFGRRGRVARATAASARPVATPTPALVGAGAGAPAEAAAPEPPAVPAYVTRGSGSAAVPPPPQPPGAPGRRGLADLLGRLAVLVTVVAWAVHAGSLTTRGLAAGRVPWGNMYEFSSAIALATTTAFLVLLWRQRELRYLGVFVMLPVVLGLGLAGTVLYAEAAPLLPALNSYWIKIHVSAAVVSFGVFSVAAVARTLYLVRARYESRLAAGRAPSAGLGRVLPPAASLDRIAYRVTAFGFPLWTFAIIAGAIWAEAAWGRYWGWDPKETWSFITWVLYAGYLHARATAGWKGRRAAWVAVAAAVALTINYYVVNIFVVGLHSYA